MRDIFRIIQEIPRASRFWGKAEEEPKLRENLIAHNPP
jgi:hypothetical protein